MNVDVYEYNSNYSIRKMKRQEQSMLIDKKGTRNLLYSRITKPGLDAFWSPGVDPYKSIFKFDPQRPFSPPALDPAFVKEPFIVTDGFQDIEIEIKSGEFEEDFDFIMVI